jgi:hypothetical protein
MPFISESALHFVNSLRFALPDGGPIKARVDHYLGSFDARSCSVSAAGEEQEDTPLTEHQLQLIVFEGPLKLYVGKGTRTASAPPSVCGFLREVQLLTLLPGSVTYPQYWTLNAFLIALTRTWSPKSNVRVYFAGIEDCVDACGGWVCKWVSY